LHPQSRSECRCLRDQSTSQLAALCNAGGFSAQQIQLSSSRVDNQAFSFVMNAVVKMKQRHHFDSEKDENPVAAARAQTKGPSPGLAGLEPLGA
jgi:hypothetical protein